MWSKNPNKRFVRNEMKHNFYLWLSMPNERLIINTDVTPVSWLEGQMNGTSLDLKDK